MPWAGFSLEHVCQISLPGVPRRWRRGGAATEVLHPQCAGFGRAQGLGRGLRSPDEGRQGDVGGEELWDYNPGTDRSFRLALGKQERVYLYLLER